MDSIDWNAGSNLNPGGPEGVALAGQQGALFGLDLGQRKATIHALQGIDLNSPDSINAGVGNLVKANALEQANALSNLSFTRQLRSQIPALMGQLTGQSSDQPQAPAAGAPDQPAADPQHVLDTWKMAKGYADELSSTPEDLRPQAFQQMKADMLKRGIPEAAIDSAGQHLAGDGPAQLSQYYGGLIAHGAHQVAGGQGEAPPMPAAHPSAAWYQNAVENPQIPLAIGYLKSAGLDLTPYLDTAKTLALPGIQKAADLAAAGPIAQATAAAQKGVEIAGAPALANIEVQKAVATKAGTLPYEVAADKARADIAAGHDLVEVPEIGADGQPTGRTNMYRKDVALNAAAKGGAVGAKPSPNEQEGRNADASLFMKNYASDANQPAIQADKTARDVALAAARLAQAPGINPSNLTDWVAHNANTLNGIGVHIAANKANDLATYKNLVDQNLKNGISVFPRNEVEFHAIANGVANAKMPGDAAALALTETAALRDAQAQYKQFRIQYAAQHPNNFSERAFQTAWAQQPQANQSIFASPLFRDLKFNGKPAVAIMQQPYTDGHVYGVFMPGTPQKTVFRVR